jgi:hypothetical protein
MASCPPFAKLRTGSGGIQCLSIQHVFKGQRDGFLLAFILSGDEERE